MWLELLEIRVETVIATEGGQPVLCRQGGINYLGDWLDEPGTARALGSICDQAGIETVRLPAGLRLRRSGNHVYAFNYGLKTRHPRAGDHLDAPVLPPAGVGLVDTEGLR